MKRGYFEIIKSKNKNVHSGLCTFFVLKCVNKQLELCMGNYLD